GADELGGARGAGAVVSHLEYRRRQGKTGIHRLALAGRLDVRREQERHPPDLDSQHEAAVVAPSARCQPRERRHHHAAERTWRRRRGAPGPAPADAKPPPYRWHASGATAA